MAKDLFWKDALTGGAAGALDEIDGNDLADGDVAVVITSIATYFYRLDASSSATEDGYNYIAPDTNPGTKMWVLTNQVVSKHPVRKNLIINGAMQVAQRGTSVAAIGNGDSGYHTLDRFRIGEGGTPVGVVTMSQDTDVPTGQGFASSLKIDCTTAEDYTDTNMVFAVQQAIEAQNLQHLKYGSSNAEDITLSFYLKSDTKTGDMLIFLYQTDDARCYPTKITIANNNWNKYEVVISGDTTGVFDNNNGNGLQIDWVLAVGSSRSGQTEDQWGAYSGYFNTQPANFLDSISNNIWITGVQLEVGSQATSFDHRSFGHELILCQRYFETSYSYGTSLGSTVYNGCVVEFATRNDADNMPVGRFQITKRAVPTVTTYAPGTGNSGKVTNNGDKTGVAGSIGTHGIRSIAITSGEIGSGAYVHWVADAEL
jgi:hypothetical protein